jgi:hypothetical protein
VIGLSIFPSFIPSRTPSLWDCATHIQGRSLPQLILSGNPSQTHPEVCFMIFLGTSESNQAGHQS